MNLSAAQLERYIADPTELIADLFILVGGEPYGAVMQPFQRALFDAIFATKPDGVPLYRLLYDERRRGESKTEDIAAAALADLLTGPDLHRSFAVAGDEDQARLIVDSIIGFKVRSPVLEGIDVDRLVVRNRHTGSELRVLSGDARTNYGIRPRRVFFDELSLQRDERQWLAMWSAIGKRRDAQLVAVSMSGWDFTGLAYRIREQAHTNPDYYFASREGSEPAPWLSPAQMEEQRLTLHPADFARFWECRWTEPQGSWITREMYDSAESGQEAFRGNVEWDYAGFVDIGLVHDATAIAVCHMEGDVVVVDTLRTLRGTKIEPVDLELVEQIVTELTRSFGVREWIFEAPQAAASVQRLEKTLPVPVTIRYPTVDTQARLFGNLYQLFSTRRLRLFPHEELRREALNLVTRVQSGRIKVVDSSQIHQDHVIALGGCADMLISEVTPEFFFPAITVNDSGEEGAPLKEYGLFAADPAVLGMPVSSPDW